MVGATGPLYCIHKERGGRGQPESADREPQKSPQASCALLEAEAEAGPEILISGAGALLRVLG